MIIICILFLNAFSIFLPIATCEASGNTIYVDDDGDANYTSIQEAVDVANDGDTIYVYSGIYYENLVVNKTINLIGEDKENSIIDGGGNNSVVIISIDGVSISKFTIQNSGSNWHDAGFTINSGQNVIAENIINNCNDGIYVDFLGLPSTDNTISRNAISNNDYGIWLGALHFNNVNDNIITDNHLAGIYILQSNSNNVTGNTITDNGDEKEGYGIYVSGAFYNNISGNTVLNNTLSGIEIAGSYWHKVIDNTIKNHAKNGVYLRYSSDNNIVSGNEITNNDIGINVSSDSNNNKISGNTFSNNNQDIKDNSKTPGFELLIAICAIALVLFWKRKRMS